MVPLWLLATFHIMFFTVSDDLIFGTLMFSQFVVVSKTESCCDYWISPSKFKFEMSKLPKTLSEFD